MVTPAAYGSSRLGVELELQLPAYDTATAVQHPSHIQGLRHSLWQCRILNPLIEARDRTHIIMDTSQVLNLLSHNGDSGTLSFYTQVFCFLFFFLSWLPPQHMEVPKLGVESEL